MKKTSMIRLFTSSLLIMTMFMMGCVADSAGSKRKGGTQSNISSDGSGGGSGNGPTAGPTDDGFDGNLIDSILQNGRAEVRQIVDPVSGAFKTKVTIPKNYAGYLYLSGLNIASLSNRIIVVRFKFGREEEVVEVPATVARAPGLTPQTDIQVLIMDLSDRPFEDVRLLYDLYDYNDYRDANGDETGEPVTDNLDSGLYCRGLKLEHDPTFVATSDNSKCDEYGEVCRYAYAKIRDSGLYVPDDPESATPTLVSLIPQEPMIDLQGTGYNNEPEANLVKKCLPDTSSSTELSTYFNDGSITSAGVPQTFTVGSNDYVWQGPFRKLSYDQWEISANDSLSGTPTNSAVFFPPPALGDSLYDSYPAGLFQGTLSPGSWDPEYGVKSFLFPREGKMELNADVEHMSSSDVFGTKDITKLVASGDTDYMHGCNIRVTNYDEYTNEGIGSCNVTAEIELLYVENGERLVIDDGAGEEIKRQVKLQLVRPSAKDFSGNETLYSSLKNCSSSQTCGANECCFNSRCWDRSLVSQCLDDADTQGNLAVGEPCNSDYECSSLCCNRSTGFCSVHSTFGDDPVLCGKPAGQSCVAQEWCSKANIPDCFIIKTGTKPDGTVECALRCYNVPTFGTCRDGSCIDAVPTDPPDFDPANPDCSSALDPPTSPGAPTSGGNGSAGSGSGSGT